MEYDEFDYEYYISTIKTENYKLEIFYKFSNEEIGLFLVDKFKLAVKYEFVEKIFKK